jgi:hypothetical protein
MSHPVVHVSEASSLSDAKLVERLRKTVGPAAGTAPRTSPNPTSGGSFFGPSVTIGEVLAYLAAAFLLGAWIVLLANAAESGAGHREAIMTGGLGLAALALIGLGLFLKRGDSRRRRGAGVAFAVATVLAAGAGEYLVQTSYLRNALQDAVPAALVAAIAVAVALVLRRLLPALITQFALLAWLTALAGVVLLWIQWIVFPDSRPHGEGPGPSSPTLTPMGQVLGGAGWWLLVALGLGVLAIVEVRNGAGDPATAHRVGLTRFWAGLIAVVGLAAALMQTGYTGGQSYGRVIEPWLAELAVVVLAVILIGQGLRGHSTAFIFAGAIGLIVALTDFTSSYLGQPSYVSLLIGGAILLAVGFIARRRSTQSGGPPGPGGDEHEVAGV